jgi:hypothetical protein
MIGESNTIRVTESLVVHLHPGEGEDRPHLVIKAFDTQHDDSQGLVVFLGEARRLAEALVDGAARLAEAEALRRLTARTKEDKRVWIATCVCGHEEEEHEGGYGACTADGCLCAGYEPEGEIVGWMMDDGEEETT